MSKHKFPNKTLCKEAMFKAKSISIAPIKRLSLWILVIGCYYCCCCPLNYCFASSVAFSKIDHFLANEMRLNQEEEKDDSVYLKAIDDKLNELKSSKISRLINFVLISALSKVSKLRFVLESKECNLKENGILVEVASHLNENENKRADDDEHDSTLINDADQLPALKSLVDRIGLKHAQSCRDKYPALFELAYSKISPLVRQRAEFKKNKFTKIKQTKSLEEYNKFLISFTRFTDIQHVALDAADHLNYHSIYDTGKCNFDEMYKKYLFEPCVLYSFKLNEVIVPVRYDASMFVEKTYYDLADTNWSPLYEAMAFNHACNTLVTNSDGADGILIKIKEQWDNSIGKSCKEMMDTIARIGQDGTAQRFWRSYI